MRVTVCVATYRRPAGLDRLLASLAAVELAGPSDQEVEMPVIVLDNDAAGSAQGIAERYDDRLPDLTYAIEPVKGISRVRNRLVELALGRDDPPDYVAFLDDDEWVERSWLRCFLDCASRASWVLVGPVFPAYEDSVPKWIREGRFFERGADPSCRQVRLAATGNLLVPAPVLIALGADPFGLIFERPGGEDALFSVLVRRHGYEVRWCDTAVVHEEVSRERASPRWLVRRAFNGGYDFSRVVRLVRSSHGELARRAASGLGHLGLGIVLLFPALVRGRAALLGAVRRCAAGAGALAGLVDAMPASPESTERTGAA